MDRGVVRQINLESEYNFLLTRPVDAAAKGWRFQILEASAYGEDLVFDSSNMEHIHSYLNGEIYINNMMMVDIWTKGDDLFEGN